MPFDCIKTEEGQDIALNGMQIEGDERWDLVEDLVETRFNVISNCPFKECGAGLFSAQKKDVFDPQEEWVEELSVAECPRCGYWQAMWYEDLGQGAMGCPAAHWEARLGKLAEYDMCLPDGCSAELAKHLQISPHKWNDLPPTRLERLTADIFKANYAPCDVVHVGQPNDGGVDVIFVDSGIRRWLVSVKRRVDPLKGESVSTLRNLLGAMVLKNARYGAVVSTVDHFTYRAYEAVGRARDMGYVLELVDRGKLDRMVGSLIPRREWVDFVQEYKPDWVREFCVRMPDPRQMTFGEYLRQKKTGKRKTGSIPLL